MTDYSSGAADGQPAAARLGLRARLKSDTRELQQQARRSGVMHALLRGRIGRAEYCALLRNLCEIYAGLESALENHFEHPQLAPILFRSLFRLGHLESDLRYLHGSGWAQDLAVVPAASAYRQRLGELAGGRPALLAAHVYVRHLGDLSDGQIVVQLVGERLGLGEAGTRFYQFGSPEDVDLLVARFGAGLDTIPATPEEIDAIAEEAREAYRRHVEMFEQLGT